MAPETQTPATDGTKEIRTRVKSVFDLDSKDYVSVVKVGNFKPVSNMQEFLERLGNDSDSILKVVNEGLEEFAKRELEANDAVPVQSVLEDGTVKAFEGTPLTEEKSGQLAATVLNIAKMMFGYPDVPRGTKQTPEEVKANRELKQKAKQDAIDFVLSNPAAIEALKK